MRRAQPRNEQGGALVVALVMLTVIGLMVGAALTYSSTSLSASNNASAPTARRSTRPTARSRARSNTSATTPRCRATSSARPAFRASTVTPIPRPARSRSTPAHRTTPSSTKATFAPSCSHSARPRPTASSRPQRRRGHRRPRVVELQDRPREPDAHGHERPVASGHGAAATGPTTSRCRLASPRCATPARTRHSQWQAQGRARPRRSIARPRRRLAAREAAPASFIQPAFPGLYRQQDDVAARRLLRRRRVLRQAQRVRQRHAEPGRLLPQLPGRQGRMASSTTTSSARACDASGQGVQIVFADSAHIKLSGTLTLPCGRSATPTGPNIALYGLKSDIAGPERRATRCDRLARRIDVDACVRTPPGDDHDGRHELPAGRNDRKRRARPGHVGFGRGDRTQPDRRTPAASRSSCASRTERTTTRRLRAHSSKPRDGSRAPSP